MPATLYFNSPLTPLLKKKGKPRSADGLMNTFWAVVHASSIPGFVKKINDETVIIVRAPLFREEGGGSPKVRRGELEICIFQKNHCTTGVIKFY